MQLTYACLTRAQVADTNSSETSVPGSLKYFAHKPLQLLVICTRTPHRTSPASCYASDRMLSLQGCPRLARTSYSESLCGRRSQFLRARTPGFSSSTRLSRSNNRSNSSSRTARNPRRSQGSRRAKLWTRGDGTTSHRGPCEFPFLFHITENSGTAGQVHFWSLNIWGCM